jgi:adenylate kinase
MRIILLMGPPGAGKGTVSDRVAGRLGCRHISTGALLREAIAKRTPLGVRAEGYMSGGNLAPDDLIMALVDEQLDRPGEEGILLDGFPRTAAQARLLDAGLAVRGARVNAVIELLAPPAVVLKRLGGRRICGSCGAGFHTAFIPPKTADVCDRCGGRLIQRDDDRDEAIERRLAVFGSEMAELRPYYDGRGILESVDATGTPEQTAVSVLDALEGR